jgi:hypothetical protein
MVGFPSCRRAAQPEQGKRWVFVSSPGGARTPPPLLARPAAISSRKRDRPCRRRDDAIAAYRKAGFVVADGPVETLWGPCLLMEHRA